MINNKFELYTLTLLLISLQNKSCELSIDDSQLLRKVMLYKSKPGVPRF